MIDSVKITKNKKKFIETSEKYNIFTDDLLNFLGEDLFLSPASTSIEMYGCYPGGLIDHLLKVCKYSIQLNNLLPDDVKVADESIIKVVFLSQIGKTFLFKPNESEWHRKNLGKMYDYNNDAVLTMLVGERSAYYAMKYGVNFTEEEYQAVINSDKEGSEKTIRWFSKPLTHIIKLGFEMAVLEEKNHGKKKN